MPIFRTLITVFFVGIGLAPLVGCAPQTLPPHAEPGTGNLTTQVSRLQGALDARERSFQELSGQVADLEERLSRQEQEIDKLHSQLARLEAPSTRPEPASPLALPRPGRESAVTGEGSLPADLQGSPTDVYLRAFGDYASGRYSAAIAGFQTFLQNFPNNSYAGNAQFWLADSHFKLQQLPAAIAGFETLLRLYPQAPKAPDALLKIATGYLQLNNPDQARQALATLHRDYPSSAAAKKADELVLP